MDKLKKNKTYLVNRFSFLFVFLFAGIMIANAQTFYVDPLRGNDNYPGTYKKPFKTIEQARNKVRSVNSRMSKDITVYLRGGEYCLDRTLVFESSDGGNNGYRVVYKSYKNEHPVITGGKVITGWVQVGKHGYWTGFENYYIAHIPLEEGFPAYFRQLWVNGRRAHQAKGDFISVSDKFYDDPSTSWENDGYIVKNVDLKNYSNTKDMRVYSEGKFVHTEQFIEKLVRLNDEETAIVMKQPEFKDFQKFYIFSIKNQIRLVNAFEDLNEPGEFYLDQAKQTVYYYPQPGEDMKTARIMVPSLEILVKLKGTNEKRLKNLCFDGITFQYGNWMAPNIREFGRGQADMYPHDTYLPQKYRRSIEGQFWLDYTDDVIIKNCRFEHFASSGIYIQNSNQRTLVEGNTFHDLTAAAVIVGSGTYEAEEVINKDVLIRNNLVRAIGADFLQGSGIYANYSQNLTIEHNDIADVAYFGINQRYVVEDLGIPRHAAGKTRILNNRVTDFCTAVKFGYGIDDATGGIYLFGTDSTLIQRNYVSLGGKNEIVKYAYYQDQEGLQNNWSFNVADSRKNTKGSFAFNPHKSNQILFDNNYSNGPDFDAKDGHVTMSNFHFEPNGWEKEAQVIISQSGLQPAYRHLLRSFGDGYNMALQASVTASSGVNPGHAVDGDVYNNWRSEKSNADTIEWLKLKFQVPINIQKIQLVPVYNEDIPEERCEFQIQLSNDPDFNTYYILGGQDKKPFAYYRSFIAEMVPIAYNTWDLYGNTDFGYRYIRLSGKKLGFADLRVYGVPQLKEGPTYLPPAKPIPIIPPLKK